MRGRQAKPPLDVIRLWRKRARWVQGKLKAVPIVARVVVISVAVLAVFSITNLVYHVLHKPTEMFSPVSSEFNKTAPKGDPRPNLT
jgi:hypothetical protein